MWKTMRNMKCEKEFNEKWGLSGHMQMHDRYKCKNCEKKVSICRH